MSTYIEIILLGLVFALDPCLLLTNIAAIGYLSKDIDNRKSAFHKGLWYTLGRTITYGVLGLSLILLLQAGGNITPIQTFIDQWGTIIIIPFLIIMGILLCLTDYLPLSKLSFSPKINQTNYQGNFGSFLMGAILSFAFCPTNALIFFVMMVPLCAASPLGYALPFLFAATTALPIILIAYILVFSLNTINRHYRQLQNLGKYLRYITGTIFIIIGIILAIQQFTPHHHHQHHQHTHEHISTH